MLRKMMLIICVLFLSACSVLPFEVTIKPKNAAVQATSDPLAVPLVTNPLGTSVAKDVPGCPSACPQPVCPQPVCPQPVWPTCPPGGATGSPVPPTLTSTPVKPTATFTSTFTPIPPTKTSTNTPVPPTFTPTASLTPTRTFTPTLTSSPTASYKTYAVQPNTPLYIQNFAHPNEGCNWLGVAGQVFDKAGKPVNNMVVVANGVLEGSSIEVIGLTGLNSDYGPGGFELVLTNHVVNTTNTLFVTLFDLAGTAVTDPVFFNTYADCAKNLAVVNFKQK
jgi:hypothetical protein